MNSPETALFHKSQILYGFYEACQAERHIQQFLVVEGYLDVIALAQAGISYAVATMGTAITESHIQQLSRQSRKIIFCFDGDRAGIEAAQRALTTVLPLTTDHQAFYFLFLPEGEDPDSMVRKEGKTAFTQRLQQSLSLSEFLFRDLQQKISLKTLEDRSYFIETAGAAIDRIRQAPIFKDLLINELAKLVAMDKTSILARISHSEENEVVPIAMDNPMPSGRTTPMQMAIALLLQYPHLIVHSPNDIHFSEFCLPGNDILQNLRVQLMYQPQLTTGNLLELWRDKPEAKFIHRLASRDLALPEAGIIAEWQATLRHVQKQSYEIAYDHLYKKKYLEGFSEPEQKRLNFLMQQLKRNFV